MRAECPICIQFFSSIIHSVKSDQDYQELQITGLPQPVPRVIPGTILPGQLQQPGIQPLGLPIQSGLINLPQYYFTLYLGKIINCIS